MKTAVLLAVLGTAALVEAGQSGRAVAPSAAQPSAIAQAYEQFLLAHRLDDENNQEGAIQAYRRAMALDPTAADIVASLADLYMRTNRNADAIAMGEQALKTAPANREAHRVLGTIYASRLGAENASPDSQRDDLERATRHLEQAVERQPGGVQSDANLRAMLARLYVAGTAYDKAIPILSELVKQEPSWPDGATLLVDAYAAANRGDEAIQFLQEAAQDNPQLYATLADFYGRSRRYREAAGAYEQAIARNPRSFDLRVRYASMLLNAGEADQVVKARDALREAIAIRATDERALYLLAQAEARTGDYVAAEGAARKLIAQNATNPRGYAVLAEALEERRLYREVVDALAPAIARFRAAAASESGLALSMLLPHMGFAFSQLAQYDNAIEAFAEVRKLSPHDLAVNGYLISAQLAAKRFDEAAETARAARADRPDDMRFVRLEAQALLQSGRTDQALALVEGVAARRSSDPQAQIALARLYADANRSAQAIKVLQTAQTRFPADTSVGFELGSVLEKQDRFADAEAAFRGVIARDPSHAAALNYLGYMLAERGERLGESLDLIKRALAVEPDNGSYLDSLGWAYFKDGQLGPAEEHLKRAADQLMTNSVVQDHYGDVLLRLGRFQAAIDAWSRALAGDGDSIDRGDVGDKIRSARQKLPR
jgi:predicted Zn-dependent protease